MLALIKKNWSINVKFNSYKIIFVIITLFFETMVNTWLTDSNIQLHIITPSILFALKGLRKLP